MSFSGMFKSEAELETSCSPINEDSQLNASILLAMIESSGASEPAINENSLPAFHISSIHDPIAAQHGWEILLTSARLCGNPSATLLSTRRELDRFFSNTICTKAVHELRRIGILEKHEQSVSAGRRNQVAPGLTLLSAANCLAPWISQPVYSEEEFYAKFPVITPDFGPSIPTVPFAPQTISNAGALKEFAAGPGGLLDLVPTPFSLPEFFDAASPVPSPNQSAPSVTAMSTDGGGGGGEVTDEWTLRAPYVLRALENGEEWLDYDPVFLDRVSSQILAPSIAKFGPASTRFRTDSSDRTLWIEFKEALQAKGHITIKYCGMAPKTILRPGITLLLELNAMEKALGIRPSHEFEVTERYNPLPGHRDPSRFDPSQLLLPTSNGGGDPPLNGGGSSKKRPRPRKARHSAEDRGFYLEGPTAPSPSPLPKRRASTGTTPVPSDARRRRRISSTASDDSEWSAESNGVQPSAATTAATSTQNDSPQTSSQSPRSIQLWKPRPTLVGASVSAAVQSVSESLQLILLNLQIVPRGRKPEFTLANAPRAAKESGNMSAQVFSELVMEQQFRVLAAVCWLFGWDVLAEVFASMQDATTAYPFAEDMDMSTLQDIPSCIQKFNDLLGVVQDRHIRKQDVAECRRFFEGKPHFLASAVLSLLFLSTSKELQEFALSLVTQPSL